MHRMKLKLPANFKPAYLQTSDVLPCLVSLLGDPTLPHLTSHWRLLASMLLNSVQAQLPPLHKAFTQNLLVLLELLDLSRKLEDNLQSDVEASLGGLETLQIVLVDLTCLMKTLVEHAAGGIAGSLDKSEGGARLAGGDRASVKGEGRERKGVSWR